MPIRHASPDHILIPMADACRSASWADAQKDRRALSERSELVCSHPTCVCPIQQGQTGRQWLWPLLPKHKVTRQPGRTPASQKMGNRGGNNFEVTVEELLGSI